MANFSVRRSLVDLLPQFLCFPALLMAVAVVLAGCHPAAVAVTDPNDPKFVVAEKGTWQITRDELNKEVTIFLKQHQTTADQVGPSKMPIVETITLKNMVLKKLLLEKGAQTPMPDEDKQEAAELESVKSRIPPGKSLDDLLKTAGLTMDDLKQQIHEKLIVENVLKTQAFKNVDPTDQQIDDIYMKNKASFTIPQKVRASRVLVHVEENATAADKAAKKKIIDDAHKRVVKGEDFAKVATEVSEDQSSKAKGGDLGFFQKGENADAGFDDVAFNTKENAISPVFSTPLGFQFLKVTAIQAAGLVPVADARNYISSRLREQNMEMQSQAYAKQLITNSGVTYHLTLVDPPAEMPPGAGQGGPGGPGGPDESAPPASPDGSAPPAGPDAGAPPAGAPAPPPPAEQPPAAPAIPSK